MLGMLGYGKHCGKESRIEDNSFSKEGLNHIGSDLGSFTINGRMDV